MKSDKNIFIAFILNLAFSVFEFFGGLYTGSIAIISDAIHDLGDAFGIGISWLLEKKSKKRADSRYTYGYGGYSLLGGLLTTEILLLGSVVVVYNAINRLFSPEKINYDGMIFFAIIGVGVNFIAALVTRDGHSLNQKAINLHMLEDVLGWAVVLIGAIVMRFTDFWWIDPVLSIAVAVFIFINAAKNLRFIFVPLLYKVPAEINRDAIRKHLAEIDGVVDVHHIHIWSIDGTHNYATLHLVYQGDADAVKAAVQQELLAHGIDHVTIETETTHCGQSHCHTHHHVHHCHHHH